MLYEKTRASVLRRVQGDTERRRREEGVRKKQISRERRDGKLVRLRCQRKEESGIDWELPVDWSGASHRWTVLAAPS